jgi:hypothetical protein
MKSSGRKKAHNAQKENRKNNIPVFLFAYCVLFLRPTLFLLYRTYFLKLSIVCFAAVSESGSGNT